MQIRSIGHDVTINSFAHALYCGAAESDPLPKSEGEGSIHGNDFSCVDLVITPPKKPELDQKKMLEGLKQ